MSSLPREIWLIGMSALGAVFFPREVNGRTISFFVHLHHATGEHRYLELAESIACDAVDKLYADGLVKAHPAKPYYEATQGVGVLLHSLLELALLPKRWQHAL